MALLSSPATAGHPPENRGLVSLRAVGAFDPVVGPPSGGVKIPSPPAGFSQPPDGTRYLLVQFRSSPSASDRRALGSLGSSVVGYVPHHAFVVAVPAQHSENDILSIDSVRHVGPFQPRFKVDPKLSRFLDDAAAVDGRSLTLRVQLFPGEPTEPILDLVSGHLGAGARAVHVRPGSSGGPARLLLEVRPAALRSAVGLLAHASPVSYVERLMPIELHNDDSVWTCQSYDRLHGPDEADEPDPKPYAEAATVWNRGLLGSGQVVAVSDTGIETETCFWYDPAHPVVLQQVAPPGALTVDPAHRKILAVNGVNVVSFQDDGSHRHGTHVSTTVLGDDAANPVGTMSAGHDHGDGIAPAAKLIFEDISIARSSSCSASLFVPSIEDMLEQEYVAGARISTNSWGTSDTRAGEVDSSVWNHEDFLVFFSAGNDADSGLADIAQFKNGVAVGATENYDPDFVDEFGILDPENMASFSSVGPAADGRVKPDLTAPGYRVFSNNFPTQYFFDEIDCDPGGDPTIEVCFPSFGGCYFTYTAQTCEVHALQGTSMAAPTAAGLAALAREYFTDGFHPEGQARPEDSVIPSAALLKAILVNGARNMTGHRYDRRSGVKEDYGPLADAPGDVQGWGRIVLDDALYFDGDSRRVKLADIANSGGLATGETFTLEFHTRSPGEPLKLTLVWTDPPAPSYTGLALINDLDLELLAPDGTLYRGNQWTTDDINVPGDKQSFPDPTGRDSINNVEGILIQAPLPGAYTATVRGFDVPGQMGTLTQGFALVATGDIADAAGAVPDGAGVPGTTLQVDKSGTDDITLTWGPSCLPSDTDYAVYEGTLGAFDSHASRLCSTSGATSATLTPAGGSTYYLVVPLSDDSEGSYGLGEADAERPQGSPACVIQTIGACE
jgi:hypothetical protein